MRAWLSIVLGQWNRKIVPAQSYTPAHSIFEQWHQNIRDPELEVEAAPVLSSQGLAVCLRDSGCKLATYSLCEMEAPKDLRKRWLRESFAEQGFEKEKTFATVKIVIRNDDKLTVNGKVLCQEILKIVSKDEMLGLSRLRARSTWALIVKNQIKTKLTMLRKHVMETSQTISFMNMDDTELEVRVMWLPLFIPNEEVFDFFNDFGLVRELQRTKATSPEFQGLATGPRDIIIQLDRGISAKDIPTKAAIAGYEVLINVKGQPVECYRCGVEGHVARLCTLNKAKKAKADEEKQAWNRTVDAQLLDKGKNIEEKLESLTRTIQQSEIAIAASQKETEDAEKLSWAEITETEDSQAEAEMETEDPEKKRKRSPGLELHGSRLIDTDPSEDESIAGSIYSVTSGVSAGKSFFVCNQSTPEDGKSKPRKRKGKKNIQNPC